MIFDSHSHYDDEAFDEDRDVLLKGLKDKNVGDVIAAASSWDSIDKILDICKKYPFVHPALGIHPENALDLTKERIPLLENLIQSVKPVAIGEIGLDHYWPEPSRDIQHDVFEYQLNLAKKFSLPIIVHAREATEEAFELIKSVNPEKRGVIHCFSASLEMAKRYIDMGYYIGIGGVVTFKNSKTLKEIASAIPLSSILIETDCPYMAPVPMRGKRNDSSLLSYVAEEIASLRGITSEEVIEATDRNARTLFNL